MTGVPSLTYYLRQLETMPALLLSFLAGAAMMLCFAPYDAWAVMFLTLPLFYLLLDAAPTRAGAIWRSFMFGYGYFMAGTWWIANALKVDLDKFGWMIPLSIFGLSAAFALWFALFGWLFWWKRSGVVLADLLRFAVLWVIVEYLRTLGIFGFPWNLAGYITLNSAALAQAASVVGTYGLSFGVLVLALLPVLWLKTNLRPIERVAPLMLVLCGLLVVYSYGSGRLAQPVEFTDTLVRVIQPNISETLKWTQEGKIESLRVHDELTRAKGEETPDIIVWSETAMPFTLYPDSVWPSRIGGLLPEGATLLSGAVRADDTGTYLRIWNSVVAIDSGGELRSTYDKYQLVPFGEFVPLREILPLEKVTPGSTDFSRGGGPVTVDNAGVPPYSPLICYEVIFPWATVDSKQRPEWLLNVTNDAWYGDSPGPYQHFAMSRMRAVERGLPLVRAANTGISAIIDPHGRPVKMLALDEQGFIEHKLPKSLPPTTYARQAEIPALLLLLVAWMLSFVTIRLRIA